MRKNGPAEHQKCDYPVTREYCYSKFCALFRRHLCINYNGLFSSLLCTYEIGISSNFATHRYSCLIHCLKNVSLCYSLYRTFNMPAPICIKFCKYAIYAVKCVILAQPVPKCLCRPGYAGEITALLRTLTGLGRGREEMVEGVEEEELECTLNFLPTPSRCEILDQTVNTGQQLKRRHRLYTMTGEARFSSNVDSIFCIGGQAAVTPAHLYNGQLGVLVERSTTFSRRRRPKTKVLFVSDGLSPLDDPEGQLLRSIYRDMRCRIALRY